MLLSLPKLFFLRRELAQCAGQFRMFFGGSCTYLRNCLPLRCELAQRAGQLRTSVCSSCTSLRGWSLLRCELAQRAGHFWTLFRLL